MLLIEAALLLESGADKMVDYVVVVDASKQLRMPRAARHLGLAKQEVKRRIHAQLSSRDMRRHADFVIHNDGTLEDLRKKTELLWRILVGIHSTSGLT
jgi:dephospho-CoA kinase